MCNIGMSMSQDKRMICGTINRTSKWKLKIVLCPSIKYVYIYIPSLTESTNSFKKIDKDKQTLESAKDQSWKAKISQASGK